MGFLQSGPMGCIKCKHYFFSPCCAFGVNPHKVTLTMSSVEPSHEVLKNTCGTLFNNFTTASLDLLPKKMTFSGPPQVVSFQSSFNKFSTTFFFWAKRDGRSVVRSNYYSLRGNKFWSQHPLHTIQKRERFFKK